MMTLFIEWKCVYLMTLNIKYDWWMCRQFIKTGTRWHNNSLSEKGVCEFNDTFQSMWIKHLQRVHLPFSLDHQLSTLLWEMDTSACILPPNWPAWTWDIWPDGAMECSGNVSCSPTMRWSEVFYPNPEEIQHLNVKLTFLKNSKTHK